MSGGPQELAGRWSTELSVADRRGGCGCALEKLDCLIVRDCNLTAFLLVLFREENIYASAGLDPFLRES